MIVRCLLSVYRNMTTCFHDSGRLESLDSVATSQHLQVVDEQAQNVNNSSVSVNRRLFSQVDRLLEGSNEDRQRALELLKAKEQQVSFCCSLK